MSAPPSLVPSVRRPGFVVAGRGRPLPPGEGMAGRTISELAARQVRQMILLPIAARSISLRRVLGRAVEPAMPFGGHLGGLGLARIHNPAPLAPAPADGPAAVVAIAVIIAADIGAMQPCEEASPQGHQDFRAMGRRSGRQRAGNIALPAADCPVMLGLESGGGFAAGSSDSGRAGTARLGSGTP